MNITRVECLRKAELHLRRGIYDADGIAKARQLFAAMERQHHFPGLGSVWPQVFDQ